MAQGGYFSFHKLITSSIIKALYVLGAVFITLWGIYMIVSPFVFPHPTPTFSPFNPAMQQTSNSVSPLPIIMELLIILFGNIFWRVYCEVAIVLFSIHENLVDVNHKLTGVRFE